MRKLDLFDDQEEPGKLNAYFVVKYVSKLSGVLYDAQGSAVGSWYASTVDMSYRCIINGSNFIV